MCVYQGLSRYSYFGPSSIFELTETDECPFIRLARFNYVKLIFRINSIFHFIGLSFIVNPRIQLYKKWMNQSFARESLVFLIYIFVYSNMCQPI